MTQTLVDSNLAATQSGKPGLLTTIGKSHWLYIALLGLLVLLTFSRFIFSNQMLTESDQLNGLDSRELLKTAMTIYHELPMWFSTRLSGMPSLDASFGDAFYPPTMLLSSLFPVHRALGLKLVLHVFLAGLFFYLLLVHGFKMPKLVAFAGAAFFMLNPAFVSLVYSGHDGKIYVIAWLPFIFWRLKALIDRPNLMNCSLFALGLGITFYAWHIQIIYYALWGFFLYWVVAMAFKWRAEKSIKTLLPTGIYFWLGIFIGLGAGFITLYPNYSFIKDAFSVRGVDRGFEFAASWSMHWPELFSLWVPEFVGDSVGKMNSYWSENAFKLNTEYAGMMVVMLGVLALVSRFNPWRIFWGVVALFAIGYAMGAHSPVFHLAYNLVPMVKKFRAASMIMYWFAFAMSLLGALFLFDVYRDRLSAFSEKTKKKWIKGLFIAMGAITLAALLFSLKGFVASLMSGLVPTLASGSTARPFDMNFSQNFVPFLWMWWLFALITLGGVWGVVTGKIKKQVFIAIVLVLGVIDLIRVDSRFIQTTNPRGYFSTPSGFKPLQQTMKNEPFRCFTFPGTLSPNGEGIYGLEGVGGSHDNELLWYRAFRGDQQDRNFFTNLLSMQDGRAYIQPEKLSEGNNFLNLANARYYLIRQGGDVAVVENKKALGRLSFASRYIVLDTASAIKALENNSYDITTTVALGGEPDFKPSPVDTTVLSLQDVQWKLYSPNKRIAQVTAPSDGFLRVSEVYYPGWEISIDGKRSRIYQSDLAWMAVGITKGRHVVEMVPNSLYLAKGMMVSIPIIGALLLYLSVAGVLALTRKKASVRV